MPRLNDVQLGELKQQARDLRMHAKHFDEMARSDREHGDYVSERMWKLEARSHRNRAKELDDAVSDERLSRRIDRSIQRLHGSERNRSTGVTAG